MADVTTPKPNVYYELGLCHGIGKDAILLKQRGASLPADFAGAHYYEYTLEDLEPHQAALADMIKRWSSEHHAHEVHALK